MKKLLKGCWVTTAVLSLGTTVFADNISTIEGYVSGRTCTLDSTPVITAILSQPGMVNGKSYSSWSIMVNDGTGSLVLYGSLPAGSSYVPAVGDVISAAGSYSPYHQIPELGLLTSLSLIASGHAIPGPGVTTIATLNQAPLPRYVAGYLWELDNVTIRDISGSFGTDNLTGTISDGIGSMTLYYWPGSYSTVNANLYGMTVPTEPVNMTGFVSVYNSVPEFTPLTITPVPEPSAVAVLALGLAGLWASGRRK